MNIDEYLKEWGSEKDVIACVRAWDGTLFSGVSDDSMSAIVNPASGGDCWFAEFGNDTSVYYDFACSEGDFYRFHTLNDRRVIMACKLAAALFGTQCEFREFIFDSGVETHYFGCPGSSALYAIHFLIRPYIGNFKIGAGRSVYVGETSMRAMCDRVIAKFHEELPSLMEAECIFLHDCLSLPDGGSNVFEVNVRDRDLRINLAFFYDFLKAACVSVNSFNCQDGFEGWDKVAELPDDALLDGFLLDDLVDPFNTSVLGDSTAEAVVRYRADESVFRVCLVAVYDVPYNYLICVDKTHA
jgi:hypothetical protein